MGKSLYLASFIDYTGTMGLDKQDIAEVTSVATLEQWGMEEWDMPILLSKGSS